MHLISLPTIFFREFFSKEVMPREPEPDLIMDTEENVTAFEIGGRIEGPMAAAYSFHTARICQVISGCNSVIDLGCGPATHLGQIAKLNPGIQFTGIDLSEKMLERAESHIKTLNLTNVSFIQDDISTLDKLSDNSFDGILSTMTLHHLPDLMELENCFVNINKIKTNDAAVYLNDFGRLKSLKSIIHFAYMNKNHQPHIFSLDYERSLRASFLLDEFKLLKSKYLPGTEIFSPPIVPLIIILKTKDRTLSTQKLKMLNDLRLDLSPRYRKVLDELRLFLRLSGLKNDPFGQ